MAHRRMFSLDVVDTDRFLDMPSSTQALYFHLGMRADDDGFVASPKRTTAMCGCSADDLNLLAAKGFVKPFESGVLVIVDWKKNNLLRPDRYTPTQFQKEKAQLGIPAVNQSTYQRVPQVSIGKDSIDKVSVKRERKADKPPRPRFTPPSEDDAIAYFCEQGSSAVEAKSFIDYFTANGLKIGGRASMKDWQAAARNWIRRSGQYNRPQTRNTTQESPSDTLSRVADRLKAGDFSLLEVGK
ncbi:hypothetical protein [uncultured Gemmiger sp.]|uniref:hypothetical protein n=1 Tax=uncultured Gemmiger sp. TaxID=1623490 RepID=UPI0025D99817|nr:hypothetical protein [uncultured Gemmiger sp.]